MRPAALLDVDGTLVDTNYHHAIAWYRAFRANDIVVPLWRIHRAVGMGGDQLIPALLGDAIEEEQGDRIRDSREPIFQELIKEVAPLEGARTLISDLVEREVTVVLASSSPQHEIEHYLDLLGAGDLVNMWTSKDDVDATKPAPDLVQAAVEKAGGGDAVLVGDTPWDIEAARKASVPTICVITGGWSERELRDAGAVDVFESVDELRGRLDESPFAAT